MIFLNFESSVAPIVLVLHIWNIGCEAIYSVIVSEEVTAQVGLCVHIPCRYTVPGDVTITTEANGFWFKLQPSREQVAWNKESPRGRMFFTGNVSERDCSLLINDVKESDDNTYHFRLEDSVRYNYFNVKPRLRVTALTDKPEISVGTLVAGEQATLTCRSPGICAGSAPTFTWSGKHGEVSYFNNAHRNHTSTYFSNITFTPSKEDNRLALVCKVAFTHYPAGTEQRIILNVEYPPNVIITIEESSTKSSPTKTGSPDADYNFIVKEGDTKMLNCAVDSNPTAEITWFFGGEMKNGPTERRSLIYNLNNISLSDAGRYLCLGKNDHGTSNRTIDIIVHYAPRKPTIKCLTAQDCTIDEHRIIYIMESATFSLLCTAQSLPEASLSWITSGPSNNRIGANGLLTLRSVSLSDEGEFTCTANNRYGKSMSSVNIKVTYKPRTVTGRNSSCWEHGGGIECTCIIQSFPTADIEWLIDGKLYPSNHSDKDLHILTVTFHAVTNSTLSLTSSKMNIQCVSSNKHGRLDLLLLGYVKSSSNIMMIAVVSCVAFIVLMITGGLLVMCYFRKKKLSMKPEDKKEINADDCSVIYSNSEVQLYGNHMVKTRPDSLYSVQDDGDASPYMNFEDVQYVTINFSKLKPKNIPENIEIEYAEIKK